MKNFVISTKALQNAIVARDGNAAINCETCLVGQAGKENFPDEPVKDSGSFYVNGHDFVGGYGGVHAATVRNLIEKFRSRDYTSLQNLLPVNIPLA